MLTNIIVYRIILCAIISIIIIITIIIIIIMMIIISIVIMYCNIHPEHTSMHHGSCQGVRVVSPIGETPWYKRTVNC